MKIKWLPRIDLAAPWQQYRAAVWPVGVVVNGKGVCVMAGAGFGNLLGNETLIDFMARFASSDRFNQVFQEGMGLVEETANYFDGPGRNDARSLDRKGSIAYATESMRLTTRLMQLASWLLLQRAISGGEISEEAAVTEKHRINLNEVDPVQTHMEDVTLPDGLTSLIDRSKSLYQRIHRLDQMINERRELADEPANPVAGQMDQLTKAFGSNNN